LQESTLLEHGGHLISAAQKYNIPKQQWIDLSTGINPNGWPIPEIPAECWQRLPEANDQLTIAAQHYYQCQSILPVAGSQAAIQLLPLLRKKSKVGVLNPAYAEHAYHWKKSGHEVIEINDNIEVTIESQIHQLDVLIVINPNNPTGQYFNKEQLLKWHKTLAHHGGWLIIDEAFIDTTPEHSLSSHPVTNGLIILRSIGKFFGLAGIRCGFIIAPRDFLNEINEMLGPWTISHPSRYIAIAALQDTDWQKQTREKVKNQSIQLVRVLAEHGLNVDGKTDLFHWIKTKNAKQIHHYLAQQGILIRLFNRPSSLRFGLPKNKQQLLQLKRALTGLNLE
jgi:cobalamin biosynthetic protein CobC